MFVITVTLIHIALSRDQWETVSTFRHCIDHDATCTYSVMPIPFLRSLSGSSPLRPNVLDEGETLMVTSSFMEGQHWSYCLIMSPHLGHNGWVKGIIMLYRHLFWSAFEKGDAKIESIWAEGQGHALLGTSYSQCHANHRSDNLVSQSFILRVSPILYETNYGVSLYR